MKVDNNVIDGVVWPFELDQKPDFAFWSNLFTPKECDKIIKLGKDKLDFARIFLRAKNKDVRKSKICWIKNNPDTRWIFEKLDFAIKDINNKYFNFDITGLFEGLQLTYYPSPGGKYETHIDRSPGTMVRKLSGVVQLTDPQKYKGGDLNLYTGSIKEPFKGNREQGTCIIFPSYTLHEVTSVIKGERWSLVFWVSGPNFK